MCKLRDDTMSQAGELPMEKKMEEMSKHLDNLSGAAARPLPSDLTEREQVELLCQVESYMAVTDKNTQTAPEAVAEENRMYILVNGFIAKRFSDIGAAVRGEEAAVPDGWKIYDGLDGRIVVQKDGIGFYAAQREDANIASSILYELACSLRNTPVSPRAADALDSQPTVAAQQGTIAADARFYELTERMIGGEVCPARLELVKLIDSKLRAPADQAASVALPYKSDNSETWKEAAKQVREKMQQGVDVLRAGQLAAAPQQSLAPASASQVSAAAQASDLMSALTESRVIELFDEEFGLQDLEVADAEIMAFALSIENEVRKQLSKALIRAAEGQAQTSAASEREKALELALKTVMMWIDNWDPDFTNDSEWPADRDAARRALAVSARAAGGSGATNWPHDPGNPELPPQGT